MAQTQQGHVLILDDEEGIRILQRRALERAGYTVVAVGAAEEALAHIQREQPDLVVLDYRLSGSVTGLDFYRHLREAGYDLPAILVSGFSDESKVIEALRAGVRDVVPKSGEYLEYLPLAVARVLRQVQAERKAMEAEALRQSQARLRALNAQLEQRVMERTAEVRQRVEQLRHLAAQLTQAEQRERQRLARILHDHLQQLLVGAKFNLNTLPGRLSDSELLQTVRQVDELLDQSLATSRSLTIELSPPILYTGTFVAVLRWLAGWMHDKHGLQVQIEADDQTDLPSEEIRIVLFQCVRELLFNIVKHAKVNQATVVMRREDGAVQVIITDEGIGFDIHPRPAGGEVGNGFGLLSIRERLEMLDGRMEITSAPGKGTRIALTAPVDLAAPQPTVKDYSNGSKAAIAPPIHHADKGLHSGRIRVLLADDHAVLRDGLARLLAIQPDMQVIGQACDGRQAVDLALELEPDVVVMDVSMPRMEGMEATRLIRAELPDTRIVALSMHAEEAVAAAMTAAGATRYLPKTSPPEDLIQAIRDSAGKAASPVV